MASSGSAKAWYVAGGIVVTCAVIYLVWKFIELCENVQQIAENQHSHHHSNTSAPIDVTAESAPQSAIVLSESIVKSECAQNNSNPLKSTVLTICPESESHSDNAKSESDFNHSEDFRIVTVKGNTHSLTTYQSLALEKLWKASKNHVPELHQDAILDGIGSCSKRLRDIFKSNMKAYRELITPGERKGTFRLNFN
jgi:hypothetical protein